MESKVRRTLVFAVAGYNLAEVGRMVEIARVAKNHFDILFMSYGGKFEKVILDEGFQLKKMEPALSEKKLAYLRKALSGETLNTIGYLNEQELEERVPREVEFFKEINPAAVLTGWCLSVTLSARIAQVPFVNVLHSTSVREYYEAGLQSWPDRTNFFWLHWFWSKEQLDRFVNKLILKLDRPIKAYNKVGKKYGLKKFNSFIELIEGDHTLLADIPEWVNFKILHPNHHYIGPLPLRLKGEIPSVVLNIPKDRPIVYFAMGSSGKPKLIAKIIEGFRNKPYRVIAPVKGNIKHLNVNIPENVIVTDFIPADKVNPMADISVLHGGQNTVMNACLSETPFVGVGMHPEQQANIDACVRKGFAVRLNKKKVTVEKILSSIEVLLSDKNAKSEISKFKNQLMNWNGPENAAQFLYNTYGS